MSGKGIEVELDFTEKGNPKDAVKTATKGPISVGVGTDYNLISL